MVATSSKTPRLANLEAGLAKFLAEPVNRITPERMVEVLELLPNRIERHGDIIGYEDTLDPQWRFQLYIRNAPPHMFMLSVFRPDRSQYHPFSDRSCLSYDKVNTLLVQNGWRFHAHATDVIANTYSRGDERATIHVESKQWNIPSPSCVKTVVLALNSEHSRVKAPPES